ncbi:magnesium transporter [Candidatus Woesebacteria bacterium]|jgi:magnesium transporter|nr:magnesium transporter [Candidatus Woesebacteria bacterium]
MDKAGVQRIIQSLNFDQAHRKEVFSTLEPIDQAEVADHLSRHVIKDILSQLDDEVLISFIEYYDVNEATDLLKLVSKEKQKRIVGKLQDNLRTTVENLLEFDPQTAAGLMNLDYIIVEKRDTIAEVAKKFSIHEKRTGRSPAIIVYQDGRVEGYIPGHQLGFGKKNELVDKFVKRLPTVNQSASHHEVVDLFKAHPHSKVVVLNHEGSVLGIIYSDDILRLMHEEESSSLYDFAGISDEESIIDSGLTKARLRYKWLIINLGTAFLASYVVGRFEGTISKNVLLAVYMPIVAGMGGNSATQTLAVLVRGISLRQIELSTALPTLKNELTSALINGAINGVLVAGVVILVNRDYKIAFILAMAMIINLLVAAFFGTLVPLIMKKLGKDPASSATIFITTATDVLGFLVFLGLATFILM